MILAIQYTTMFIGSIIRSLYVVLQQTLITTIIQYVSIVKHCFILKAMVILQNYPLLLVVYVTAIT